MLTTQGPRAPVLDDEAWFARWRARELRRVARSGVAYLDYTGAALYPESLVRSDARRLVGTLVGNPHSEHDASRTASADLAAARAALLDFVHAPPDEYAVILTANTSGACRLVGESFPFGSASTFLLTADNHNSVNGIREYARTSGAQVRTIGLGEHLRLREADSMLASPGTSPSLFAFPAQSNFSGVRHPLRLVEAARARGWRVLLDAAAYLPTSELDLAVHKPDFVTLSLYKIAGYPTGVGALIARHDALMELRRPWFAGGTVRWVSVQHGRHRLVDTPEAFEDGTPSFLAAAAVAPALQAIRDAGRERLARHLSALTGRLLEELAALRHGSGRHVVRVHGPPDTRDRGPTLALTIQDDQARPIPYWVVEQEAREAGIALRGGCFCNPGCAEAAFRFPDRATRDCLDALGGDFTIPGFASCLGGGVVGAIRASLGLGSLQRDVDRLTAFLSRYRDARAAA